MTRLHIKIKDSKKATIVFNLLKELPFIEIEKTENDTNVKPLKHRKKNLEDIFGLWENREISIADIRKKAWTRNYDSM
jgi:hypothetical protein